MRNRILYTAALLGIGLLLGAQVQQERLLLLTDRGHYISGETIRYRAFYRNPEWTGEAEWSHILYVELILPNGTPLVQGKVKIEPFGAMGTIAIPEDLSSGTYYLKAYTRWMMNCGPEGYLYTSLQIYDPYSDHVLPENAEGWEAVAVRELLKQEEGYSPDMLECRLVQESFQTRQEVVAELTWKFPYAPVDLTVSVTRTGLHGNQTSIRPGCPPEKVNANEILPELRGLSITGQAVNSADGSPVPYATVYISELGAERDFFCNYSDSVGRFYFSFPDYTGNRELFVSANHSEFNDLELLIDRDFSQDHLQLPSYPVQLDDSLAAVIAEMSVNAQVSLQYDPPRAMVPEVDSGGELLFYGTPGATIYFDDFVRLPNLAEYFIEVIPQVAVKKSRGVRRFVLLGEHPDLLIYSPLLLIDGVAIFDVEAVLAVSPGLIERVEIVNAPYIRGSVTFGGIISLISKNRDLGYIDLPSSGLLVNYRMLEIPGADPGTNGVADPRLPDVRNTLYWNPELKLNPGESQKISFRTADLKGACEMLIRGVDVTGKFLEKRVAFTVKVPVE